MRRILWILPVLVLIWAGYWAVAGWSLRSAISGWMEARRAEGWQAEAALSQAGFPTAIRVELADLALADPDTALAIGADALALEARALWPGDLSVILPPTPVSLATPQGRGALQMQDGVVALDTYPGAALEIAALGWTAGAWTARGAEGALLRADGLRLTMTHLEGAAYALHAEAPGFAPGAALRESLRIPAAWPAVFDLAEARAEVAFDRPWDRRALDDRRPQPRRIALSGAEARWGDLRLRVAADLDVDAAGVPTGTVNLRAENWPVMLDLAVAAGLLNPGRRLQAEGVLSRLAALSGSPDALDVQLNFARGMVAVGFIPVGPAPRIVIR